MRAADGLSSDSNSVQLRSGRQIPDPVGSAAAATIDVDELLANAIAVSRSRRRRRAMSA